MDRNCYHFKNPINYAIALIILNYFIYLLRLFNQVIRITYPAFVPIQTEHFK